MAYQTGNIRYRGSFKSIRQWRNTHDPKIYAGEKGGANRNLILRHRVFKRTRENMREFGGCGAAVRSIRLGLLPLIPEHVDTHFTARLTSLVKIINLTDREGMSGNRDLCFSQNKALLKTITFHAGQKIDHALRRCIRTTHPETRNEATLSVTGFNPDRSLMPGNAQYYRVIHHLSILSDFVCAEWEKQYHALSKLDQMNVTTYSDYVPVNTPLEAALRCAFPEGVLPGDSDSVIGCVGIEFYIHSGARGYLACPGGSMMVYEVF